MNRHERRKQAALSVRVERRKTPAERELERNAHLPDTHPTQVKYGDEHR